MIIAFCKSNSLLQTGTHGVPLNSKLLLAIYKGMAPGDERKSLPSIDVSSKVLVDGLLQLSFSLGVQVCECDMNKNLICQKVTCFHFSIKYFMPENIPLVATHFTKTSILIHVKLAV